MSCFGLYSEYDASIAAVSPEHYNPTAGYDYWPCGTQLVVSGPAGEITVTRSDKCGGCAPNVIDLSERGSELVCGGRFTCRVTIRRAE